MLKLPLFFRGVPPTPKNIQQSRQARSRPRDKGRNVYGKWTMLLGRYYLITDCFWKYNISPAICFWDIEHSLMILATIRKHQSCPKQFLVDIWGFFGNMYFQLVIRIFFFFSFCLGDTNFLFINYICWFEFYLFLKLTFVSYMFKLPLSNYLFELLFCLIQLRFNHRVQCLSTALRSIRCRLCLLVIPF